MGTFPSPSASPPPLDKSNPDAGSNVKTICNDGTHPFPKDSSCLSKPCDVTQRNPAAPEFLGLISMYDDTYALGVYIADVIILAT